MLWTVEVTGRAAKQVERLPVKVREALTELIRDIEFNGPVRGDWPNYSQLNVARHHCHLKKGRPTYVAIWEVRDKTIRLIEVTYAGTHEKAPY